MVEDARWWRPDALTDKVLIVDRDTAFACAVAEMLARAGHPAAWSPCGETALLALAGSRPAAVVIDLDSAPASGVSGHRLFQLLRHDRDTRDVPVVLLSDAPVARWSSAYRPTPPPDDFLIRPANPGRVVAAVTRLIAPLAGAHRTPPAPNRALAA